MKEIVTGGVLPMMTHLMDDARETLQARDKRIAELESALKALESDMREQASGTQDGWLLDAADRLREIIRK